MKPQREELFNFKSALGQSTFFEMTNNSEKFRKCFKTESAFLKQAATFENTLRGYFQKSIQKIRGKKRKAGQSEVDELIQERKVLRIE